MIIDLARWIAIAMTATVLAGCGSSPDEAAPVNNDPTNNTPATDNPTGPDQDESPGPDSGVTVVNPYANGWIVISVIRETVDEGNFVEDSRHEFAYDLGTSATVTETMLKAGFDAQKVASIRVDANGFPVDGQEEPDSANPKPIQFTYASNGELSALQTSEFIVNYEYDGAGQLSRVTRTSQGTTNSQSQAITNLTRTGNDQVIGQVSRGGQTTQQITYQLDAMGRISLANVQETNTGGVREYSVSYDSASNPTQIVESEAGQPVARTQFIYRQASQAFFNIGLMPFGIEEPALLPRP